jgi:hypothetical protein
LLAPYLMQKFTVRHENGDWQTVRVAEVAAMKYDASAGFLAVTLHSGAPFVLGLKPEAAGRMLDAWLSEGQ